MSTQDRYETKLETRKTADGKLVYRPLIPKSIQRNVISDLEVSATDATRMDKLAFEVFGTPLDWWKIASLNGRVDGSLYFRPGTKIYIPTKA